MPLKGRSIGRRVAVGADQEIAEFPTGIDEHLVLGPNCNRAVNLRQRASVVRDRLIKNVRGNVGVSGERNSYDIFPCCVGIHLRGEPFFESAVLSWHPTKANRPRPRGPCEVPAYTLRCRILVATG